MLLGLIAMAQDVETLYAGVKALVCVVRSNKTAQNEMDRKRYYQTLAMLLKRKKHLLNSHILHLAFSLVGTVDSGRESSAIPNVTAFQVLYSTYCFFTGKKKTSTKTVSITTFNKILQFLHLITIHSNNFFQDLLCDLDVWHEAPGELLRSHLEHLHELAAESSEKKSNTWMMRDLQLVTKLIHIISNVKHPGTRQVAFSLLSVLLSGQPRPCDLLWFGQYIAATLPPSSSPGEKHLTLREDVVEGETVLLRNRCLALLHGLLFTAKNAVNVPVCEEITRILGFDWVLLFLQPHVHASSVIWGLRILIVVCANPVLMNRFREGTSNGGWLRNTEQVTHNKMAVVLGYQYHVNSSTTMHSGEQKSEVLHVPGFQHLSWLMPAHLEIPEVYFLLTALMMGQPVRLLPADTKFDLDFVWAFLWGASVTNQPVSSVVTRVNLCSEAVVALLSMARSMLHVELNNLPEWLRSHPIAIVQVLFQLYHNMPDFMPVFMSAEVLTALASVLFPFFGIASESAESSGQCT